MGITFNADEIFEMAEEIERNGAKFYRQAAQKTGDEKTRKMFLDMAAMEDTHLEKFEQMRKELTTRETEPTIFDPDNQAIMYLRTVAASHGYEGRISPQKELTGAETTAEILRTAINSEKESVVFYTGLKEIVPPKAGKDRVEEIIKEELSHITTLAERLNALDG